MPGVQTFLAAMLRLVEMGDIDLRGVATLCARNPALRFGLGASKGLLAPGFDADLVLLDPAGTMTVRDADQLSKSGYSQFDGMTVPWALAAVYVRGGQVGETGPRGRVAVSRAWRAPGALV